MENKIFVTSQELLEARSWMALKGKLPETLLTKHKRIAKEISDFLEGLK